MTTSPPTRYVMLSPGNYEVRRLPDMRLLGYVTQGVRFWKANPLGGDTLPQDGWTRHTARQILVKHFKKMEGIT